MRTIVITEQCESTFDGTPEQLQQLLEELSISLDLTELDSIDITEQNEHVVFEL